MTPYQDFNYSTAKLLFPNLRNLKTANLSNNFELHDNSIIHLVHHCRNLRNLDISRCSRLTSKSLFVIVKNLKLEYLNVSYTRCVTNKSWLNLCAMNETIRTLKIAGSIMINWEILAGIVPQNVTYLDISNNCALTYNVLSQIVKSRTVINAHSTLKIDARNCDNITGDEFSELKSYQKSKIEIISNPKLRNHDADGVLEYLKSLIDYQTV